MTVTTNLASSMIPALRRAVASPILVQQAQFQSEQQGVEQQQEQQLLCLAQRSLEASAE